MSKSHSHGSFACGPQELGVKVGAAPQSRFTAAGCELRTKLTKPMVSLSDFEGLRPPRHAGRAFLVTVSCLPVLASGLASEAGSWLLLPNNMRDIANSSSHRVRRHQAHAALSLCGLSDVRRCMAGRLGNQHRNPTSPHR